MSKNTENDYFNQCLGCAAPKRWSKYITILYLLLILLDSQKCDFLNKYFVLCIINRLLEWAVLFDVLDVIRIIRVSHKPCYAHNCVCIHMCVCLWERETEREIEWEKRRDREREREREIERGLVCVCVCVCVREREWERKRGF